MNWKRILTTWLVVFLALLLFSNWMNKSRNPKELNEGEVALRMSKTSYATDQEIILKMKNNTAEALTLPLACPKNPFRVLILKGTIWEPKEAEGKISCEGIQEIMIPAGEQQTITYAYWNHALFSEPGTYSIEVPITLAGKEKVFRTTEFTIEEAGIFRTVWNTFFYRPLLNLLIFLTVTFPGHYLATGIILLTLIVRLLLLIPSQHAMQSQKRLQEVQPKLEALKKKYAGNQERIAKETMELWKQEKVNPFGSCLPLIIQFPILIAIFYVVRNGLNPDNAYLLYKALGNIDFSLIQTGFLGIFDLTRINAFILPVIVGLLQYFQMKMSVAKKSPAAGEKGSEMQMANRMMVYFMPILIALFTASVPAGVGLYWGVSTLFALGQQYVVNRNSPKKDLQE